METPRGQILQMQEPKEYYGAGLTFLGTSQYEPAGLQ